MTKGYVDGRHPAGLGGRPKQGSPEPRRAAGPACTSPLWPDLPMSPSDYMDFGKLLILGLPS